MQMTETVPALSPPLAPLPSPTTRYIKLGPGSRWARRSLEAGEIHFGHSSVPHELALSDDRQGLITFLIDQGRTPGKARDFAREIMDFYTLGPDTIWITMERGQLWWARAELDIVEDRGEGRLRRPLQAHHRRLAQHGRSWSCSQR